jgi:hypothetical protein
MSVSAVVLRLEAGTFGGGAGWPLPPVVGFDAVTGLFVPALRVLRRKLSPAVPM